MQRNRFGQFVRFLTLTALGAVMFGCSNSDKVEPTLGSLWDNTFKSCGLNCHSADGTVPYGPDLTTKEKFRANLLAKTVDNDYPDWITLGAKTSDCNDTPFTTASDANHSTLAASLIQSVSDSLSAEKNCNTAYNIHEVNKVTINDRRSPTP